MRPTFLIVPLLLAAGAVCAKAPPEPEHSHLEEITKPDPNKAFNIDKALAHRNVPGTFQGSKNVAPNEFYIPQKFTPKSYETHDFSGKKQSWFASLKFWTKDAPTKGAYEIPNATKAAPVKTAPTKDAREASKTVPTRELVDAHRPYVGPEAAKLKKGINPYDPNGQPRLTQELHELKTIEDVKALLNKN